MLRNEMVTILRRVIEAASASPETRSVDPLETADIVDLTTVARELNASRYALMSDEELEGLARDLKPMTPWLIDVNMERARRRAINAERDDATLRPLAWGPVQYRTNRFDESADRNGDRYVIRRTGSKNVGRFVLTVNGEWHGGYGTQAAAREAADNIARNRANKG